MRKVAGTVLVSTGTIGYQMGHTRTAGDKVQKIIEETVSEKQVRVLLANGPRFMRELVREVLADQSDIDVIGEIENNSELASAIEQALPDVLIIALDENVAAHCGFLIGQYPRMRILALAPEQNRGQLFWAIVEFRSRPVESSEAGLLSALREHPCLGTMHQ